MGVWVWGLAEAQRCGCAQKINAGPLKSPRGLLSFVFVIRVCHSCLSFIVIRVCHSCLAFVFVIRVWHSCLSFVFGIRVLAFVFGIRVWHSCLSFVFGIRVWHSCLAFVFGIRVQQLLGFDCCVFWLVDFTTATATNTAAATSAPAVDPRMQGWLQKQGNFIKTWRDRYCVLDNGFLFYYKDPTQVSLCGSRLVLLTHTFAGAAATSSNKQVSPALCHRRDQVRHTFRAGPAQRNKEKLTCWHAPGTRRVGRQSAGICRLSPQTQADPRSRSV